MKLQITNSKLQANYNVEIKRQNDKQKIPCIGRNMNQRDITNELKADVWNLSFWKL